MTFDRAFWDERWTEVLRDHPQRFAQRAPNAYLAAEVGALEPGRALDAGCGNGTEALWLATRGWSVTAVDFSAAALTHGKSSAEAIGSGTSDRIDWLEADLGQWTPAVGAYDLVSSLYVHIEGSVEQMVERLASAVATNGRLLLVGHLPVDPVSGIATRAAGQRQVTVEAALAALDGPDWEVSTAETRPRVDGSGHDAVISAKRLR